jgi:hypothetical protein
MVVIPRIVHDDDAMTHQVVELNCSCCTHSEIPKVLWCGAIRKQKKIALKSGRRTVVLAGRGMVTAVHMVGVGAEEVLSTGAEHARVVHQNRNRHAKGPREGLPEVEGPVGTITANVTQKVQRCAARRPRLRAREARCVVYF